MKVKIIRELSGFRGNACLVERKIDEYFVVSSTVVPSFFPGTGGFETLAFPASRDGKVVSWAEVAGGRDTTREETIEELEIEES